MRRVITIGLLLVLATAGAAVAQFGFERERFGARYDPLPNIPYDGRFTFARVRYHPSAGGYWPG